MADNNNEAHGREYFIPPNISETGKSLGGLIDTRKMIEAAVIATALSFLFFGVLWFLPTIVKIILTGVITLPAFIFAVIGIKDVSLTEWLFDFIEFNKNKQVLDFKMPRPASEKKGALEK